MTRSHKKLALIGAAIVGAGYLLNKFGIINLGSAYSGPIPGADGPIVDDPDDFQSDTGDEEDDEGES